MSKNILVVDDLAIFREPIEMVLRTKGYGVVTASNGVEALRAVCQQMPDLVLLDLSMPVLDGIAVLRALREQAATKTLPVLVLSAKTERSKVVEAIQLGISGYLLKANFSLAAMLDRVQAVLSAKPGGAATMSVESVTIDAGFEEQAGPRQQNVRGDAAPKRAVAEPAGGKPAAEPARANPVISVTRNGNVAGKSTPTTEKARSWTERQVSANAALGGRPTKLMVQTGDDLKLIKPLLTRSEVMKLVNTDEELQGFSPTVSQILKLTASSQCSMEDVSKAVGQDHAVALKILKLANSSIFSRGDRVDTVQKAVLRIGIQSIRQAVMNIAVVERFGGDSLHEELSTPLFWEHSIATGIIAAEIAHALGQKDADIAFTAGLLHDLGRILYAERLADEYGEVLKAARTLGVPLEQAEARLLQMSHADVMDKVLHAWRFPKDLISPIVFHHAEVEQVKAVVPRQSVEVLRLSLANRLAHAMLLGSSGNDVIYPTHEHCTALGVSAETIGKIESTAREQTDDTKFALLSRASGPGSENWPRLVDRVREEIGMPVRALFVGEHGPTDAYRIFAEAVSQPAGLDVANVAVVHIAAAKEREPLAKKLMDAERQAGLPHAALPVIVLSPAKLALEESVVGPRATCVLSTPTSIMELADALRRLVRAAPVQDAA